MKSKLNEELASDPSNTMIDIASSAIESTLIDYLDVQLMAGSALEMIDGIPDEDYAAPARFEDVEHWATKVTDSVLADDEFKEMINRIAVSVLRQMI